MGLVPGHVQAAIGAVSAHGGHVGRLNSEASGGPSNTNALNDTAGQIAGAVSPLNPSGNGTDARKQLGTDALTLVGEVQKVLTGGGDPQLVVDEITKVQGECSALGH